MTESARTKRAKNLKQRLGLPKAPKVDSNLRRSRRDHSRTPIQLGVLGEARREMLAIAQDFSPAAMLRICEMGGLIEGVPPATSEAVQFACCQEVLDRAHGRPRPGMDVHSNGPLLVDFAWRDDAPARLLEAAAIGDSDGEP